METLHRNGKVFTSTSHTYIIIMIVMSWIQHPMIGKYLNQSIMMRNNFLTIAIRLTLNE